MNDLPVIPAQDFFLGLASAGLLLSALFMLARPRGPYGHNQFGVGSGQRLFARIPLDRRTNQFSFLGALFLHLILIATVPWLAVLFPDAIPFDLNRYDLVLVQFKTKEEPLRIPSDIAKLLEKQDKLTPVDNPLAIPDTYDDPGRGNLEEAPKLEKEPGGEDTAQVPKKEEKRSRNSRSRAWRS
ncbi:MAG: hypothetical protein R2748_27475 [Bryobacterales bacterium]